MRLKAEVRSLDRRQRNTARFAAALAVSGVLGAAAFVQQVLPRFEGPRMLDEISARSIRADRVAVTGDLRLLDAAGKELAVLGRELDKAGASHSKGPVVLALKAEGDPSRQLLRLAASKTGAGLTIEAPTGSSSVSLLSMQSGSTVEVRNGEQTQRFAGDTAGELASVAAGPKAPGTTASDRGRSARVDSGPRGPAARRAPGGARSRPRLPRRRSLRAPGGRRRRSAWAHGEHHGGRAQRARVQDQRSAARRPR